MGSGVKLDRSADQSGSKRIKVNQGDRGASGQILRNPRMPPPEEPKFFGRHVVHDLMVELLTDVKRETGDFTFSGSHGRRHAVKAMEVEQKRSERALEAWILAPRPIVIGSETNSLAPAASGQPRRRRRSWIGFQLSLFRFPFAIVRPYRPRAIAGLRFLHPLPD